MSFYGQIIQEFTKLFSKFTATPTNTSQDATAPASSAEPFSYLASNMWEEIKIQPANVWIQMRDGSTATEKILKISHGTPGTDTSEGFIVTSEMPEGVMTDNIVQIQNGDYLIVAPDFDKAGHLNASSKNYYKLPVTTINIGTDIDITPQSSDDKLHVIDDDHWIALEKTPTGELLIKHVIKNQSALAPQFKEDNEVWAISYDQGLNWETTTYSLEDYPDAPPPEAIDATKLKYTMYDTVHHLDSTKSAKTIEEIKEAIADGDPSYPSSTSDAIEDLDDDTVVFPLVSGEIIKTNEVTKDENGHIIDVAPKYFQLPVSASDLDFAAHGAAIETINKLLDEGKIKKVDASGNPVITGGIQEWEQAYEPYADNVELLEEHETFLRTTPEGIGARWQPTTLYSLTGSLENMYSDTTDGSKPTLINQNQNIATTIGAMDGDNSVLSAIKSFTNDPNKTFCSLSEAIQTIIAKTSNIDSILTTNNIAVGSLGTTVNNLNTTVNSLDTTVNGIVDSTSGEIETQGLIHKIQEFEQKIQELEARIQKIEEKPQNDIIE